MRRVDAVLLDFGNVLVFHDDQVLLERFAGLGGKTPEAVALALQPLWDPCHKGRLAEDELRRTVAAAVGAPDLDDATFRAAWSCHFRVHHEVMPLVEGLLRQVKVLLLSNTNAMHIAHLRPQVPVLERFHHLVLSHEVGLAKPDPAIFVEALRRAGTTPERTAFFDDVEPYVAAARALGIHGHVFTDAHRFRRQLEGLGLA